MKNSDKTAITNEGEANEAVTAGDDRQRPMKDGVYVERRQGERRSGVERRDPNSREQAKEEIRTGAKAGAGRAIKRYEEKDRLWIEE